MKHSLSNKFLAIFLSVMLVMSCIPVTVANAAEDSTSVADPKTLSQWESWFPADSDRYAGGIFLDKSVYTATEAKTDSYFEDIRSSLSFGNDSFGNENFMVALSAVGSNSEVLGYSHTPTDTILVLDASTSMGTGDASSSSVDDMVNGANEAIKRLLALNNYNRVGVVIYNGSASVLLPLDRYTAGNTNGDILRFERSRTGSSWNSSYENRIYIASGVTDGNGHAVATDYNAQAQGTYTQGGIYAAAQEFLGADTVIEDGKIQGGTNRIPIMVLMTDGEPSYRTQTGNNNTINRYSAATNANADRENFREDEITAFSTMLTAAWAEGEISAHYNEDTRFYTLGYALSANHQYAQNVLDPMNPNNALATRFTRFATQYLAAEQNETAVIRNESNHISFRVTRASSPERVTTLDYVDRYWRASQASQLSSAFDAIVDEIVIQSRYYSTLVSNNNYAQDGFVSFTDEIGTYMEVKDIKGLYIGEGKLVSGGMFAEFATTGKVTEFDSTNYSEQELAGFENEILNAASERFGISLSEAARLINSAKANGFISYTSPDEFSNYISWYADENNGYLAPYTNASVQAPDGAKYIVRSYFYMGDVVQNHVETSMLYALVRVREDIQTGRQIVDMDVPAALLPMVTYTITVDGDVLTDENVTGITCEQKKPISLLFEVGLDSEINPINISEKVKEDFRKDENGIYTFYTNRWRDAEGNGFTLPDDADPHIFNHGIMNTTVTQFVPSLENERFYFTENVQLLDSSYNVYTGSKPSESNSYFVEYKWIEGNKDSATVKCAYNPVSPEILKNEDNIIQLEGRNGWFIRKGTPQFYFGEEVHGEQAHSHKVANPTETLGFSDYPQVVMHESEEHSGYHMLNYHGNNGLVKASPAQGIKLSKAVSQAVAGASDEFDFEISLSGAAPAASYPVYIEYADGISATQIASVDGGKISITLGDGDVAYIYSLPVGTEYSVEEAYSAYYVPSYENADGTVNLHTLSSVEVTNSPKGYGSLLVEKDVTHPFSTVSAELAEKAFEIEVEFIGDKNDLALITASDSDLAPDKGDGAYTYSLSLKDGHDVLFTNIPEGVKYTVTENNIPDGFTLTTNADSLEGTISAEYRAEARLINDYEPAPVSPKITVSGEKTLNGREWNDEIDKYQVALQQVVFGGQGAVAVGEPIIADIIKTDAEDYEIDMSSIVYDEVGTYSYVVYEVVPDEAKRVDSVSYDSSFAIYSVTVADKGTGTLVIDRVTVHQQTASVSGNAQNGWSITKDFKNEYQTSTVRIPAFKQVVAEDNSEEIIKNHSGGIMLALYDSVDAETPVYSTLTDENGEASFVIGVKQSDYESGRYYYLREVIPLTDSQVVGMTYDTEYRYVISIEWADILSEAPEVRYYNYDESASLGVGEEITDIEANPLVITNTFDDGTVSSPAIEFSGKKTLNGGALRSGDEFVFELYETDATFDTEGLSPLKTVEVNAQTPDGAYSFDEITFDSVGTKYLVVSEKAGTAGGIGYDDTKYHITVDVTKTTDSSNKTILEAELTHIHKVGNGDVEADMLNFNNTYTVNDTEEVTVSGTKVLNGRKLLEGEFEFVIEAETAGAPLPSVTRVKNSADGKFSFPTIRFDIANEASYNETYTYTIKEIIPDAVDKKGITYNSDGKTEYILSVNLKDDGNGGITKTVTLDGRPVSDINAVFENSYSATDTSLSLSGTKSFNKPDGEFWFDLYEADENFAIISDAPVKSAKAEVTNGTGTYEIILNYTSGDSGYHYYVLKEAVPAETKGIYYDAAEYHIAVSVVDNGQGDTEAYVNSIVKANTTETATVTSLNFTNKYVAAPAEAVIKGLKTLKDKQLEKDMFEFTLSNDEGEIATVTNDENGEFYFPAQIFEEVGTYVFRVEEVNGGSILNGIFYDEAEFTVTLPVLDDGEGSLYVDEESIIIEKLSGEEGTTVSTISFVNEYSATPVEVKISGTKLLDGRELEDDEFRFLLSSADSSYTVDEAASVREATNKADGSFEFDTITYTSAGTYYYVITEDAATTAERVTNDSTVYHLEIEIRDDGEGKLYEADRTLAKAGSEDTIEHIVFTNIFTPKPEDIAVGIDVVKTVVNTGSKEIGPEGFEFVLVNTADGSDEKVKTNAEGRAEFTLTYTEDDIGNTYTYTLSEVNDAREYVQYSSEEYLITVSVSLNSNNELIATLTVNGSPVTEAVAEFENIYNYITESVTVSVSGTKILENRELAENEFKFLMYPANNSFEHVEGSVAAEAVNSADGTFTFKNITFSEVGTYYYVITEDAGTTADRVTNDSTVYHLTLEIRDDGEGKLYEAGRTLVKEGSEEPAEEIVFTNIFTPKPEDIAVSIDINKTVLNQGTDTIGPEGFEFVLEKAEGEERYYITSDENGYGQFTLVYTEDDIGKVYTYTLTEVNDGRNNVQYSDEEYVFTVSVSLGENNELVATLTENGEAVTALTATFENIYDYTPEVEEEPEDEPEDEPKEEFEEEENDDNSEEEPEEDNEDEKKKEDKPKNDTSDSPQTNDTSNLLLWFALMFISGGGIMGNMLYGRKKKENEAN